jgi:vitamin B12 transporter
MRINSFIFVLFFSQLTSLAQESYKAELDSVVVLSSRIPQRIAETGRSISILNQKEIAQLPVQSLDEVFRYIPGIETQQRAGYGVQSDITMRGSTFTQVLVLLDGMRINDPLTGHFNNAIPVSLAEIDHVEVIRGPASALYGPDAVGGVINIITKTFNNKLSKPYLKSSGSLHLGQNSLMSAEGGISASNGNSIIGIGGQLNSSDGYPYNTGLPGKFNVRSATLSFLARERRNFQFAYRIGADMRDFNAQNFYTQSPADSAVENTSSTWNQLRIKHTGTHTRTIFDGVLRTGYDNYLFNSRSLANTHHTGMLSLHLSHQFILSPEVSFMTGMQTSVQSIRSTDRGDHSNRTGGIYGIAFFKPLPELSLNSGIRAEFNQVYGFGILPQLAASWQFHNFTFRFASGKSFRSPDFTERFVGTALPVLAPGRNLGNPELNAEKAWTSEIGTDFHVFPFFTGSATLFTRNGFNLIDYVSTPSSQIPQNSKLTDGASYFYARNLSHLVTQGIEIMMGTGISASSGLKADLKLGYTFLHTNSQKPVISTYLSNHARDMVTGSGSISFKGIRANVLTLWKERDLTKPMEDLGMRKNYLVWNGLISYSLWNDKLAFDLRINNIFDKENMDFTGLHMPGRWTSAGISWQI